MIEDADIAGLLEGLNDGRKLVISRQPRNSWPGVTGEVTWLSDIETIADLQLDARHDIALVFDQLSHMNPASATHLLSALRDRHARRVIVLDETLDYGEFLSLGFERLPGAIGGYEFDLDSPSRQREWNNSGDWANPANFDKFRW